MKLKKNVSSIKKCCESSKTHIVLLITVKAPTHAKVVQFLESYAKSWTALYTTKDHVTDYCVWVCVLYAFVLVISSMHQSVTMGDARLHWLRVCVCVCAQRLFSTTFLKIWQCLQFFTERFHNYLKWNTIRCFLHRWIHCKLTNNWCWRQMIRLFS